MEEQPTQQEETTFDEIKKGFWSGWGATVAKASQWSEQVCYSRGTISHAAS